MTYASLRRISLNLPLGLLLLWVFRIYSSPMPKQPPEYRDSLVRCLAPRAIQPPLRLLKRGGVRLPGRTCCSPILQPLAEPAEYPARPPRRRPQQHRPPLRDGSACLPPHPFLFQLP